MDINTCLATTESIRNLALYSHAIPALAVFLLGIFAVWKARTIGKAWIFFSFALTFCIWLGLDLTGWITNNYYVEAAIWAPIDFANMVFFLLLFYFVYVDVFGNQVSRILNVGIVLAIAAPFVITLSGNAVYQMNQPVCEMLENPFITNYTLGLEIAVLLGVLGIGIYRIISTWGDRNELIRETLVVGSIILFMGIFGGAEYISAQTDIYEITLYSLFTLPIFILLLTISITSYGTFRLGDAAVKVLFYIFLVLAATQFFFVNNMTDFLLACMSFGVVLTLGTMLFRVSEKEIALRHLVEKQEQELEIINKQQENLLHFISHEIKGYLTKSEGGFAGIVEGDYGTVTSQLKQMATTALADVRKGVATIMQILNASNLKKGTVNYVKKPFDLKTVVLSVVDNLKPDAQEKNITIETSIADGTYLVSGDEERIRGDVIGNIVDNAVKYSPAGIIHVELARTADKIRFSVKDNGVGITKEDMQHLFTEGGHGKDSIKVNVHSTGYGLFIAKSIVEAHGGRIWAESEGAGKGSRFILELPAI